MKMFKVFVNNSMKRTMMADTRVMYLQLDRGDEVDCICDQDCDVQSFEARKDGSYVLTQNKEGALSLRYSSEEE
jgi:hypothetical protein